MIQVFRIPMAKPKLNSLSKDERVLLFLLGYVSNQTMMLEKLVMFAGKRDSQEFLDAHATGIQQQMLLRLMIGALNEAWRVIVTRFNETFLAKEYLPLLDDGGQKALSDLKKQFGSSNLLTRLRTNYAFHHPQSDDVEAAFQTALNDDGMDEQWNLYFAQHGFNSLFYLSEIVISHGIFAVVGETDWREGQERIMAEVISAANNVNEFAKAFTKAVWLKHFGDEMIADKVFEIHDAPPADQVEIPFFVEMPGERPLTAAGLFRGTA
jgi:hypothetical protein